MFLSFAAQPRPFYDELFRPSHFLSFANESEGDSGAAALQADVTELDEREETLARRVAEAHAGGIPCLAVVGAREVANDALTLREGNGAQRVLGRDGGGDRRRTRIPGTQPGLSRQPGGAPR